MQQLVSGRSGSTCASPMWPWETAPAHRRRHRAPSWQWTRPTASWWIAATAPACSWTW